MYVIAIIFGLVLLWCVGAIIVLLVWVKRAKYSWFTYMLKVKKLEYEFKQKQEIE